MNFDTTNHRVKNTHVLPEFIDFIMVSNIKRFFYQYNDIFERIGRRGEGRGVEGRQPVLILC